MSCRQKIELENAIFARAACVGASVYARSGRLVSPCKEACLQALLQVYNAFFYEENFENFCTQENSLLAFAYFQNRPSRTPVLSAKEYNFELILGGKNDSSNSLSTRIL